MKTVKGLIGHCNSRVGGHYLYGYKGQKITKERNEALARQYPSVWTPSYLSKANSWIGDIATDCSGLISEYTGILRGSYEQEEKAVSKVTYTASNYNDERFVGWAVWLPGHIGVLTAPGEVIEARGQAYGIVKTKAKDRPFQKLLKLCDIDYTKEVSEDEKVGWHQDKRGWWYRHTQGTGPATYCHDGIFMLPSSRGTLAFAFDSEGYMITDAKRLNITEFGNIKI